MRRNKKQGAVGVLRRPFPEAPGFLSILSAAETLHAIVVKWT